VWSTQLRLTVMGTTAHGLKAADATQRAGRGLTLAVVLALLVSLVAGSLFVVWFSYSAGAVNFFGYESSGAPHINWGFSARKIQEPFPARGDMVAYMAAGAAATGLMQFCRDHFVWWPFSVVGFVGAQLMPTAKFWFSIFIVWLIKGRLIRYGGKRLFLKVRPLFLGMILGHALCAGFWYALGALTDRPLGDLMWW
jgi:hypothetical protein